jgi:CheY-like chemotaxis protein
MISPATESLLIVEDSDEDFAIFQRLMQRLDVQNPVYRCLDGDEVLELLYQVGTYHNRPDIPRPSVILLDLNLPGTDGRELLSQLKQDRNLKEIPIVVFTISDNPEDIKYCYREGANGYLIKPLDTNALQRLIGTFVDYWLAANTSPRTAQKSILRINPLPSNQISTKPIDHAPNS